MRSYNDTCRQNLSNRKRYKSTHWAIFVSLHLVLTSTTRPYFSPSSFHKYGVDAYSSGKSHAFTRDAFVGGIIRIHHERFLSIHSQTQTFRDRIQGIKITASSSSLAAAKAKPSPPQDFFGSSGNDDEGGEEFFDSYAEEENIPINDDSALLFGNDFLEGSDDYELFEEEPEFDENGDIVMPMTSLAGGPNRNVDSADSFYDVDSEARFYDEDDSIEEDDTLDTNIFNSNAEGDDPDDFDLEDDPTDDPLQEDLTDPN
jgi:hypothetical protein